MELTCKIALEVASHEAVIRQAYKDIVGVWTWSVGLTNACGHNVDRYIDNPQSLERCLEVYVWALRNYADAVRAEFRGHELSEAQFGGALSLHWNTGAIRSATWPDLWKAGKIEDARRSFLSWRKPPEIIPRREKEAALFFHGEWSNDGTMIEYCRLRADRTPDWSSAARRDVAEILQRLLGTPAPTPAPDAELVAKASRYDRIAAIVKEA